MKKDHPVLPALFATKLTPADRAIAAHMSSKHHRSLIIFLRSDKEITPTFRWYLADVLEGLAYPKRGRPRDSVRKNSTELKYERLAKKEDDVAAIFANEIVHRWRKMGCKNACPNGKPINQSACSEAIKVLRAHEPGRYRRTEVPAVQLRMRPLAGCDFRRLWDHRTRLRGAK
ncbi:hypothetical protein [Bradyrhizobium sp. Ec3.3]|uniref:hypothetical protein n=1 Tax=Bradyrhizobium sp. Ec3.3 TaxID=189753 RepID=UPI0012ECA0A6|nr:hypothetical protein [Bradyrhizobium sp. Ec3.3]